MNNNLKTLLITSLLIAITSCSFTKGKGMAESAVTQYHNEYNSGQFHDIYNQADEGFRKSGNEASLVEYLQALQRKLGTVKQSHETGWHVNTTPGGTMVTIGYDVEFSEGKGTEQFVFRISGDKALLYSYNVNSPLLITR
ncbi:MAG TPA: hypothetical protein VK208_21020 [Pyrinomonadaceae bacterium]|nr:hypothetical protein [Pyrinomonadaceae bacterium]